MDVARGAMEIERSHRLRRLTTLLKQYRVLPEPDKDRATKTLQSIVLTSHENQETRQTFREIALDTGAGVLPANELSARELFPSASRIGDPTSTRLLPDGQVPSLRPSRNVRNEIQESSLNKGSKNQNLETGLQSSFHLLTKFTAA